MPYNVEKNIGDEEMDEEGRIITAEYSKFYLVCVYVPNAARGLVNLDRRLRWNKLFEEHVTKLKENKPVVICGDMNVAHEEIGGFYLDDETFQQYFFYNQISHCESDSHIFLPS